MKDSINRAKAPNLNCKTAMLCWNPGTDQVALVPWGDRGHEPYQMTALAPFAHVHKLTFEARKALAFIEAMHLIVRDGCDPYAVHRAMLGLEEYQAGLADDALWDFAGPRAAAKEPAR